MKKRHLQWICILLLMSLTLMLAPTGAAAEDPMTSFDVTLSKLLDNEERRNYVRAMVRYYITKDAAVRQTLEEGYSALFFFEGCSDNMDDPELSDLSYYRVSAVCLGMRLNGEGEPYLCYFNESSSTLPDRPLEYGAWELEDEGEVGPATVRDGTYQIYSVRHGGAYEALHVRTDEADGTLPAVYMTPEGYATARATYINIHTRTVNHTIEGAMWSSGCLLVGDGDFGSFLELMESVYYPIYDSFSLGDRVGTLTIDRQMLKQELYELYEDADAVEMILASSRKIHPQTYLNRCEETTFSEPLALEITVPTQLMSLPCGSDTDVRSLPLAAVEKGDRAEAVGAVRNSAGNLWYVLVQGGQQVYLFSGCTKEPNWLDNLLYRFFG